MQTSRSLWCFAVMATLALSTVLYERSAYACTPQAPRSGYVSGLVSSSIVVDDTASPVACRVAGGNSCEVPERYNGIKRILRITATLADTEVAGTTDTFVPSGSIPYVLRDAAGAVVEQAVGTSYGATFTKTGAKVCVKTQPAPSDAGVNGGEADAGAASAEFCAPVGVADLLVTTKDLDVKGAKLLAECGSTSNADAGPDGVLGVGDGGVGKPVPLTGSGGGGCAMGASGSSGMGTALLLPLAALVLARLRRRRSTHSK
jgi:hypothetical protein